MIFYRLHSNWIPSGSPTFPFKTKLEFINEEILENSVKRLTFNLTGEMGMGKCKITKENINFASKTFNTGPSHRNLFIYPLDDNQLINWNLMEEVPKVTANYKQRHAYFVFTGHGKINEPVNFFIDIQVRS